MSDKDFEARFESLKARIEKARKERAKLEARKERLDEDWKGLVREAVDLGIKKKKGQGLVEALEEAIEELEGQIEERLGKAEKMMGGDRG